MKVTFEIHELIDLVDRDTLGYYTEGHIDVRTFAEAAIEEFDLSEQPVLVKHEYWRNEESDEGQEGEMLFITCGKTDAASYPVTVIYL